ncbi:MAG: hypothetical protein ACK5FI_09415, partial [Verrucomicrobiota bacterium]
MSAPEPCLVLDGSARAGVRVGVLAGGRWVGQGISPDGALEGLFGCVEAALAEAKLSLADIRSFALCVGPGSVLGIRIAALAVRSWSALEPRPIFVWESLSALARSALVAGEKGPFLVAVESRLKRWHALEVAAEGTNGGDRDGVPAHEPPFDRHEEPTIFAGPEPGARQRGEGHPNAD